MSTLGGIRTGLRRVPQVQTAVDGEPAEIMRDATARVSSLSWPGSGSASVDFNSITEAGNRKAAAPARGH